MSQQVTEVSIRYTLNEDGTDAVLLDLVTPDEAPATLLIGILERAKHALHVDYTDNND